MSLQPAVHPVIFSFIQQESISQVMGIPASLVALSAADYPVSAAVSVATAAATSPPWGAAQQSAFVTGLATDMALRETQIKLSEATQSSSAETLRRRRRLRVRRMLSADHPGGYPQRRLLASVLTIPFQISGNGPNAAAAQSLADRLRIVTEPGSWVALRLSASGVAVQSVRLADSPVVSVVGAVSAVIPFLAADPTAADRALAVRFHLFPCFSTAQAFALARLFSCFAFLSSGSHRPNQLAPLVCSIQCALGTSQFVNTNEGRDRGRSE